MKFFTDNNCTIFDTESIRAASRLWTTVLEISVLMAQFPSKEIAELSYTFRTLGLGYANIGAALMVQGIPYDSQEGVAIAGAITAIMHMKAYETSAELAGELGAFDRYERNKNHMLRVMRNLGELHTMSQLRLTKDSPLHHLVSMEARTITY